jgi:DNA-binding NtrC family response regulator
MHDSPNLDLLLVEDDEDFREAATRWFGRRGYNVESAAGGEEALALCAQHPFQVGVFDLNLPRMTGLDLLTRIKAARPEIEVILLSGSGTIESAVEAMKGGAYDFLTKPFPLADLERQVMKAGAARSRKQPQPDAFPGRPGYPTHGMIGRSPAMQEVYRLIDRAGPSQKPILIQGASGTGKELVAQALRRSSPRAEGPLVIVNCAALPEQLLESEFFGHEKGAFSGAVAAKPGLFEIADGGTIFIDEIGELALPLQAKLLRVLEDGSLRRVGSLSERRVDVRIVAATNRNLAAEVQAGRFREDLYYRINVMSLELPALCERPGDIRLLVENFLGPDWNIEDQAFAALEAYAWPGNVRQLINTIERAKILADDRLVRVRDLPAQVMTAPRAPVSVPGGTALADLERNHIQEVLTREHGNKSRTAQKLGINRRRLDRLLERHAIPVIPRSRRVDADNPGPGPGEPGSRFADADSATAGI